MKLSNHLVLYLIITTTAWASYAAILTPIFLYDIGLDWNQFFEWLWKGALIDYLISYPISLLIIKESKWFEKRFNVKI